MATFYFNNEVDGEWTELGNWWTNSGFTTQATSLPTSADDVIAEGSIDSNSGSAVILANFTLNDPLGDDRILGIDINVTGTATFTGDSRAYLATIIGNAIFNNNSRNLDTTIYGDVTFSGTSSNGAPGAGGEIYGDAVFNNTSSNAGTVSNNATFNGSSSNAAGGTVSNNAIFNGDDGFESVGSGSRNEGAVTNNATFNESSYNNTGGTVDNLATFNSRTYNSGTANSAIFNNSSYNSYAGSGAVTTDATFNDSSYNGGTVSGNAIWSAATFTNFSLGTVSGTITFSNASPVVFTTNAGNNWTYDSSSWTFTTAGPTWTFDDASTTNSGTLQGDATFNDVSNNTGTVSGNATFDDNAYNNGGTITGNATFNGSSNNQTGTVSGSATFNGSSHNDSTVSGNATFNGSSYNSYTTGVVSTDATFNGTSYNAGTVAYNATFNGSSSNQGVVGSLTTFNDNSGCTAAASFIGNITVNYPVPVPLNSNGNFGTITSLGYNVGITYVGYSTSYLSWNPATAPVDTWTHIALVRINGICRLYADGVTVLNFSNNVDLGASHIVTIGTGAHNLGENFPGYIDEVRISSSGIYNGDFSPPTSPLTDDSSLLLLHFDGNMTDSSSHSLTVGGTATTTASESKFGGSSIDTSSSYAEIGSNALFGFGTGDFTIEMWIYPTSVSAVGGLINIGTYDNGILIRHGSASDTLYMSGSRTLYYNNGYGQNNEWNDQKNWFFDTNYSYLPSFIPTSADSVITNNSILTNGAGEPTIQNFSSLTCEALGINLTVTGMATFTCSSANLAIQANTTLTGNATFNGASYHIGTVTGSGIFNDTTHNDGTVGYGIFNDTSSNGLNGGLGAAYIGYVTNNAVFNDSSTNGGGNGGSKGIVSGNAIFNDSSVNNCYYDLNDVGATPETGDGFVHGSATFRGQSKNQKGVGGSVILAYDKGINGSNILGIF